MLFIGRELRSRTTRFDAMKTEPGQLQSQGSEPAISLAPEDCERYRARLHFLCLRKLRSPARAEDVVQSAFLVLLEAIRDGRLRDPSRVPAFLVGVANNLILKQYRDEGRRRPVGLESVPNSPSTEAGAAEQSVQLAEDLQLLRKLLRRLSARDRDLLRLHLVEERPTDEICARLAIRPGALRVRLHRIRRKLRRAFSRARGPRGADPVTFSAVPALNKDRRSESDHAP